MSNSRLRAAVYVSPRINTATFPDEPTNPWSNAPWQPISSTLIYGPSEALLVDTPITASQTKAVIDWIEETLGPDRSLTHAYITHGHGDHFFGLPVLKARWPDLKILATTENIAHMAAQLEPASFKGFWTRAFPDIAQQLPTPFAVSLDAETLSFSIDNYAVRAVPVGRGDTADSTVLHVPTLDLVVAGDVVYGDAHQFLLEADTPAKRSEWIAAVETVEGLKPRTVVCGHKKPGALDGPEWLQSTKDYIAAFDNTIATAESVEEVVQKMVVLYPERLNPHILAAGAAVAMSAKTK